MPLNPQCVSCLCFLDCTPPTVHRIVALRKRVIDGSAICSFLEQLPYLAVGSSPPAGDPGCDQRAHGGAEQPLAGGAGEGGGRGGQVCRRVVGGSGPLSSLLPVAVELGLSTSRTSHSTLIHPEASSSSCAHSHETDHAELGFFACPLTGVQDHAYLFGLCYRMLGSRLVFHGDQWLKLADDHSFCLRSEERRSASVDSRQSGGSHLDGECSRHRRDRSRSPHRRKRNKDKDRSWGSRRRKER